jgi:acyl-CoA synthetase (AMP-forming)/AMP-acid ligase II
VDIGGAPGIAAFVEAPADVTVADLFATAENRLPPTMLPDQVHVVGSIPMTPQGKVDRRRLLAATGHTPWLEGRAPYT